MHGRRAAAYAVAALAALTPAGCTAGSTGSAQPQPTSSGPSRAGSDPAALVGSWHLDAPGEPADAVLTIGDRVDGGVLLFRPCGVMDGTWRANHHAMLVMHSDGGDQTCFLPTAEHPHPLPTWLLRVASFRADGSAELLLDRDGAVVARLTPGAHPRVRANRLSSYALPPVVTAQMRASWQDPAPLPTGVRPATATDVVGRWVPVGDHPSRAYVAFRTDGTYDGSDGCNGAGGQFQVGPEGIVLATSGASTLIGCKNSPLPSWVAQSGRLGIRKGRLVFVSPTGKVLGAAVRRA